MQARSWKSLHERAVRRHLWLQSLLRRQHEPSSSEKRWDTSALEYTLGGWVCVVAVLTDLEQVATATLSQVNPGQWASVLESPGVVDSVQWIGDSLEFLLCSNNAGPTTYYVPWAIAPLCPNLERSMAMTHAGFEPSYLK